MNKLPAYQPTSLKFGTVNIIDLKGSQLYKWDGIQANGKESLGGIRFRIASLNMVDNKVIDHPNLERALQAYITPEGGTKSLLAEIPMGVNGDMHGLDVVA